MHKCRSSHRVYLSIARPPCVPAVPGTSTVKKHSPGAKKLDIIRVKMCVSTTTYRDSHLWVGESSTEQAGYSRTYIPLPKYGDIEIVDQRRFDAISVTQKYIVHVDVVVDEGYRNGGSIGTDAAHLGGGFGIYGVITVLGAQ